MKKSHLNTMNRMINLVYLLLFIRFSLSENNLKIKDVLRNSSKYSDRNKTDGNNSDQNQSDDIFRSEILKNFRQCVSKGDENDYDENDGGGKHRNMKNGVYKRNNQSGNYNGMKNII